MEYTISWKTIFRIIAAGVFVYLVWVLIHTILVIITAIMLASAFNPFVRFLEKKMPPVLAAVVVFLLIFLPIVLIIFTFIPNLIAQFPDILKTVDNIISRSSVLPRSLKNIDFSQYGQQAGSYLLRSTSAVTGFITTFLTIIFLMLYFLIDTDKLLKIASNAIPDGYEKKLKPALEGLMNVNGHYIRGNLLISVICGLIILLGLIALSVPYAASLALFAAICDLLPLIGAFVGIVPAAIIGFAISPTTGILVLALFIGYQEFENNVISPNVYTKALDLSPALTVIAVIIGAALFGMLGAFIALPIAASLPLLVKYLKPEKI